MVTSSGIAKISVCTNKEMFVYWLGENWMIFALGIGEYTRLPFFLIVTRSPFW